MKDNLARRPQLATTGNKGQTPCGPALILPGGRETPPVDRSARLPAGKTTSRWLSALLIAVLVHSAPLVWWLLPDNEPAAAGTLPPAAMVIELAPAAVAPASRADRPPGPERAAASARPEVQRVAAPQADMPPAPPASKPEVAVNTEPKAEPEQQPRPLPPPLLEQAQDIPPRQQPPGPASAAADAPRQDEQAAAPKRGAAVPAVDASVLPDWQSALMFKLNEAKRYPSRARRYRQQGVAYLRFTMDRQGNVLAKSIEQSSGHRLLDKETLALLDRVQPLPEPPAALAGKTLEFVIPVEFFLRR